MTTNDTPPTAGDDSRPLSVRLAGSIEVTVRDVADAISRQSVAWIAAQRWFGSKSRQIVQLDVNDVALDTWDEDGAGFALVGLTYSDDDTDTYLLPFIVTGEPDAQPIATLPASGLHVIDGPPDDRFRRWFMDRLEGATTLPTTRGMVRFEPTDVLARDLDAIHAGASQVVRGEQSNSSVIWADAVIGKLFRRLQDGINPDLEIGRFFTEQTQFRNVPAVVGGVSYFSGDDTDGRETSLAIVQEFVRSKGDAWSATLTELRTLVEAAAATGQRHLPEELIDTNPARVLGRRTGEMHVALASSETEEAFVPEPVTPEDVAAWERGTLASLEQQRAMLDNALPRLSPAQQRAIVAVDLSPTRLASRVGGYRALEGTVRIRVHGDYHLGQVLRSLNDDVILLDFEGEPLRTIAERREKTAALKDVAGMLRSIRYARGAVVKDYDGEPEQPFVDGWLETWERASRTAFLDAYRAVVATSAHPLVPADDEAFFAALDAWELDKALYELSYEANNRPAWLDIPLITLAM